MSPHPTSPPAALVLATSDLRGRGLPAVVASLKRLLLDLGAQTRPLASLAEVVIAHDGLPAAAQSRLERAAGVPLRFVEVPPGTGYHETKNRGFDATSAAVVVFGDGDCWPEPQWLERLLAPFDDPRVEAVAGRTTLRADLLGQPIPGLDLLSGARRFRANNVAFRREVFAVRRYETAPGRSAVAGIALARRLERDGVHVRFEPAARTVQRLPALAPRALEWVARLGLVAAVAGLDTIARAV